jgi:hypothetical protein
VGWDVTTEFIGESKSESKWIADVYCTKGNAKVALKIPLSQQTEQELEYRHRRYLESGVRDAWFTKSNVYKNSVYNFKNDIPRFEIRNIKSDNTLPAMVDYKLSVAEFVKKLLTGDFEWKENIDSEVIYYMGLICWKCSKGIKSPVGIGYTENSNFNDFIKTVPNCSTFYEKLIKQFGGSELEHLGLTTIGPNPHIKGNAPSFPFCVKCTRCYAPQSNYYTLEKHRAWTKQYGRESHYVVHTRYHHNGRYKLKGGEDW